MESKRKKEAHHSYLKVLHAVGSLAAAVSQRQGRYRPAGSWAFQLLDLGTDPRRCIHVHTIVCQRFALIIREYANLPIDTGAGEAGADTTGCEPILFELLDIPGLDTGRAKENAAVHFQGVVEFLGLD